MDPNQWMLELQRLVHGSTGPRVPCPAIIRLFTLAEVYWTSIIAPPRKAAWTSFKDLLLIVPGIGGAYTITGCRKQGFPSSQLYFSPSSLGQILLRALTWLLKQSTHIRKYQESLRPVIIELKFAEILVLSSPWERWYCCEGAENCTVVFNKYLTWSTWTTDLPFQ